MRTILYTGKGGVGKTTAAAATAVRLADRGVKTLLVSTDAAHSVSDALGASFGDEPTEVADGLFAAEIDTGARFQASWGRLQQQLAGLMVRHGADSIAAEELTVLPGVDDLLALLAVNDYAERQRWDAIVVDCAPTAETLRLLALPESFDFYLRRLFPMHRQLARALRPIAGLFPALGEPGSPALAEALLELAAQLTATRTLLADPARTSVRIVTTPEAVVAAESRRTLTALSLYGYVVDELVVNRVFPESPDASGWQRDWLRAQRVQLEELTATFEGVPQRRLPYLTAEPTGVTALREVGNELYGESPGQDPIAERKAAPLLSLVSVAAEDDEPRFALSLALPAARRGTVAAARNGDELVIDVAGHRRVLTLPSVLRRCEVVSASFPANRLVVVFRPDPALWRSV